MRNLSPLEYSVDEQLEKRAAGSVLGEAETTGGAVARGAAYAAPLVGTGLSFADSWNDFKNGDIKWGLANLGFGILGLGSDALTALSLLGGPTAGLGVGQRAALGTAVAAAKASRMARAARVAGAIGKGTLRHLPAAAVATAGELVPVMEKRLTEEQAQQGQAQPAASPGGGVEYATQYQKGEAPGWARIGDGNWDPSARFRGEGLDGLHSYQARHPAPLPPKPAKPMFGDDRLSSNGPLW